MFNPQLRATLSPSRMPGPPARARRAGRQQALLSAAAPQQMRYDDDFPYPCPPQTPIRCADGSCVSWAPLCPDAGYLNNPPQDIVRQLAQRAASSPAWESAFAQAARAQITAAQLDPRFPGDPCDSTMPHPDGLLCCYNAVGADGPLLVCLNIAPKKPPGSIPNPSLCGPAQTTPKLVGGYLCCQNTNGDKSVYFCQQVAPPEPPGTLPGGAAPGVRPLRVPGRRRKAPGGVRATCKTKKENVTCPHGTVFEHDYWGFCCGAKRLSASSPTARRLLR